MLRKDVKTLIQTHLILLLSVNRGNRDQRLYVYSEFMPPMATSTAAATIMTGSYPTGAAKEKKKEKKKRGTK